MQATEIDKLAALEDTHWWYSERRHLLRSMINDLFPGGASGRVALDVGAAAGGNTRVLREMGLAALALEYGEQGLAIARERGLTALRADARRLPIVDGGLDLVIAFDVLEHIDEDAIALAEMARALKPGGFVIIAVPAGMDLWSAHDDAVGHVRRYSSDSLVELARQAGLEVCALRSWNVLLRRAAAARRRRLSGSDLGEVNAAMNGVLKAVIALERRLTYLHSRPGMSLIMVARRDPVPSRAGA